MQNLAGHPESTHLAKLELDAAGIPVVVLEQPYGEPKSWVGGELHGFLFRRAWYYWVVKGPMPIDEARRLYADKEGAVSVRVAGMAGNDDPDNWAEWYDSAGHRLYADPDKSQSKEYERLIARRPDLIDAERFRFVPDPSKVPGVRAFVTSYHVDSADGLRLLADVIRSLQSEREYSAA